MRRRKAITINKQAMRISEDMEEKSSMRSDGGIDDAWFNSMDARYLPLCGWPLVDARAVLVRPPLEKCDSALMGEEQRTRGERDPRRPRRRRRDTLARVLPSRPAGSRSFLLVAFLANPLRNDAKAPQNCL